MTSAERPGSSAPRPYSFPATTEQQLENGLRVVSVPLHRLPAATVLFTVDAGAERDPVARAGIGAITAQALGEGTASRTAPELAGAFERLGGELHADAGWTHAECGTTVLSAQVIDVLGLLADVVRNPRFSDEGVHRLRRERLAELLQQRAEPRGMADDLFAECCFAAGDRYGLPSGGAEQSVMATTPEDVRACYQSRYSPHSSLLIVSGDVPADDAVRLADDAFGSWSSGPGPEAPAITAGWRETSGVHLGHRPDAPQSEIRVGHASVARTHPDFFALAVMNAILGGLFNSRINMNLREAHAYTYGAFSAFGWRRSGSVFEVSTAVKSDVTASAVREILGEIDRIRAEPVRTEELSLATDYLTGVFPLRFETTAAIADAIAFRSHLGLSTRYYDEYRTAVQAVTADDVQRVANAHLEPARLQVVVVGDAALISQPLEALGLGDVRRVEAAS